MPGLLLAFALSYTWFHYGAGPLPSITTLSLLLLFLRYLPSPPRRVGLPALLMLLLWDRFGQWPSTLLIAHRLYAELLLETLLLAMMAATIGPPKDRREWTLSVLGFGTVFFHWLTVALLVLGLLRRPPQRTQPAFSFPVSIQNIALQLIHALPVAMVGVGWAYSRSLLDPTPAAFSALLAGAGLGVVTGGSVLSGVLGLLALGIAGFGIQNAHDSTALHIFAGLGIYTTLGLGLGWLMAWRQGTGLTSGLLLTMGLVAMLPGLPDAWARQAVVGTWGISASEAQKYQDFRSERPLQYAKVGWLGSTGLRVREGRISLELEGMPVDPSGRMGQAERFAGVLGGCVSPRHRRAMVIGDDTGLVTLALKNQGFGGIDVAVPDRGLVASAAMAMPLLQKLWLDPRIRLLTVPGSFLGRFGDRPDVVVQVLRHPWMDGLFVGGLVPVAGPSVESGEAPAVVQVVLVHLLDMQKGMLSRLVAQLSGRGSPVSLWMPPSGVDSALLVVSPQPIRWSDLQACAKAEDLKILGLKDAMDLSSLALAVDPDFGTPSPFDFPTPGLFPDLRQPPQLLLTDLSDSDVTPGFFVDAPPERAARVKTRGLLLKMLATSAAGKPGEALAQAKALSEEPGGEAAIGPLLKPYLDQAQNAIEQKDWTGAEAALSAAQGLFPGAAEPWCWSGNVFLSQEKWREAADAFGRCSEKDAGRLEALDGMALALQRLRDVAGAEKALRRALSAHPEGWTTAQNLGWFLYQQGRPEEAERWLIQASARNAASSTPSPVPDLALARVYLSLRKFPLALAQAQRSLSHQPTAEGLFLSGAAHYELNHLDLAEQSFSDCLQLDPDYYLAKGGLGQIQAARGQYKLAAASFEAVLKKEPQNEEAKENLSRLQRFLR